jgi:hypothetical protein
MAIFNRNTQNTQNTRSEAFRTAHLAINAYKNLVAQSEAFGRTNVDRTQIGAQQIVVKNAIADVTSADEIAELRAYWNA